MKTIVSLFSVFVVLALAVPAEAQYGSRGGYGGYGQRRPLPGGWGGGGYEYGYNDPRMTDPCYGADQFYQGMRGTMHAHNGQTHFRPCDPTNSRINTVGGGALASAGGAAIGGAFGGRKGAAVGAVGGAIAGGVIASRNAHDNCIVLGRVAVQQDGGGASLSYQDQLPTQQVPSPIDPVATITWPTVNTTDFRAVVTDPSTGEKKLIPAGGSMPLHDPSGEQPYTVVLLEPGRGKSNPVPGEIRPSQDLQGWEIVAR